MGSASGPPKPPDTSKYSDEAFSMGQQQRGWAEEMWATGKQEWGKLQDWSQSVMGASLPAMEESFQWARDQRDRYEQYVVPQMQSLFSEAELYASKGEEDRQRGAAIQDVKSASEATRAAHERKLKGYGIDPSDLRHQSLDAQAGVAEAAMSAFAANQAGERTKQVGRDLRNQAINVGSTFLNDASAANAMGANVGTGALGTASNAAVSGSQASQGAMPYMGGAMSGVDLGAGIVDTSYGRQLDKNAADNAAAAQNFDEAVAIGKGVGHLAAVAEGGAIAGPGGPTDDAGAVAISDGEYVIPADVVRKMGTNHFDKMIEKETGRAPPGTKQAIPLDPNDGALRPPAAGTPMGMAHAGVLR